MHFICNVLYLPIRISQGHNLANIDPFSLPCFSSRRINLVIFRFVLCNFRFILCIFRLILYNFCFILCIFVTLWLGTCFIRCADQKSLYSADALLAVMAFFKLIILNKISVRLIPCVNRYVSYFSFLRKIFPASIAIIFDHISYPFMSMKSPSSICPGMS